MLRMVGRRLLISIALLVVVPALTFLLESFSKGNAVDAQLGVSATPEQRRAAEEALGLNLPVWERYLRWMGHAVQGDLGKSVFTGQPVVSELNSRLPVSLSLIIGATVLTAIVGIAAGVFSARRRGGALARLIDGVSVSGVAIPNFLLGVILVQILAVSLPLLPATGYTDFAADPGDWARSLVLPVIALAFAGVTAVAKQTRDQMLDTLDQDFIRNLRANGAREGSVIYRHALRNAAIPIVTVMGLLFVGALSGSVVVENVFVLPGLGSAAVQATTSHDFPVIQGISVYFTLIVIIVNVIVDLTYGWLNPKVRAL